MSIDTTPPKKPKEYKTKTIMAILFVIMMSGIALVYHFYQYKTHQVHMGKKLIYDEEKRSVYFYNKNVEVVLTGTLGLSLEWDKLPSFCSGKTLSAEFVDVTSELCLIWKDLAHLTITHHGESTMDCFDVSWLSKQTNLHLQDCFDLGSVYWYGMGLISNQKWPLNLHNIQKTPYLTESVYDPLKFGPLLEPYWLSTDGVSIMMHPSVPLHVSLNQTSTEGNITSSDHQLCLYSDHDGNAYPPTSYLKEGYPHLNYTICVGENVAQVHTESVRKFSKLPSEPNSFDYIVSHPVWSVASYLHGGITQETVQQFVNNIVAHGYTRSLLMLDNMWQDIPGELRFADTLFPDPESLIRDVKSKGFKFMVNADPYLNYNSNAFRHAVKQDMLVHNGGNDVPGFLRWWSGDQGRSQRSNVAGIIDMYPEAQLWLHGRLSNLSSKLDLDGFQWLGGQMDIQPRNPTFRADLSSPNGYLCKLAELGSKLGGVNVLQGGFKSQHVQGVIRIYGSESSWGGNGLASVIPTVLTLGILGYPFILPDVIGGNGFQTGPSKELYIRWLELTAFLQTMHFSTPPDSFDSQTVQIAKEMIEFHTTTVVPIIKDCKTESLNKSLPIIRPLWLMSPSDIATYTISDQFTVCDKILVAPVIKEGQKERDIYIPDGIWTNKLHGNNVTGPIWLRKQPVPLSKIAYFEKVNDLKLQGKR